MIRFQTRNSSLLVIRSAVKVLLNSCRLKTFKNRKLLNALKEDKCTSFVSKKKKSASEACRAVDLERGKGATLPLPRLKLGWLRPPRFFALAEFFVSTFFPHCGAWDQAITPRTQTEYRKSKGGKDRQNWRNVNGLYLEKCEKQLPCFFQFVLGLVC